MVRLEAPTRSLHLDAPKGVHIKAVTGSAQAVSRMDISLLSMDGVVRKAGGNTTKSRIAYTATLYFSVLITILITL